MTSEPWTELALPEVIEFREGPGIMARDFRESGVPLIRLAGLSGGDLLEGCNYLDPAMVDRKWSHFRLRAGDTLLSTSASLGRIARVTPGADGAIPYTGIIRMRPKDGRVDPDFVQYMLEAPQFQRQVEAMGAGSVMRHFGPSHLTSMKVVVPPLAEQERIDSVLGALDDKIDSNRRLARLLEEIAQTEFQARFVSFVAVENLTDREQGPTPAGWEWRPVSALARYVNGKAFTKFGNGCGRMVIRIADLKSGPGSSTVYTDHEPDSDDFVARPGDILFAWSGSLDVYRWHREEALINQHIFKVLPDEVPKWLVYLTLKEVMPRFQAIAADKATTMGHIKRSDLARFAIPVPPEEELRQFDSFFSPIFDHSLGAVIEAQTLTSIRDSLLPKLVSGQVRVPDTADPGEAIEPLVESTT